MATIGVLSLQGAVTEHLACLNQLENVRGVAVKTRPPLEKVDALIIPGGESTAIGKLLKEYDLIAPLQERIKGGMPVWGTCAGMILLANRIVNQDTTYLNVLDVAVRRNAYGSQLDSFQAQAVVEKVSPEPFPLVFIRAPYIEQVGPEVEVLLCLHGHIVAVQQQHILATAFHPELTGDLRFHRFFVNMLNEAA
ncbi:MAG: pyridoxal 5'-phosphate synthase glutaminase subunit PdxT [Syntrophomonadaceae bacterium]